MIIQIMPTVTRKLPRLSQTYLNQREKIIVEVVCSFYNVSQKDVFSRSRKKNHVFARQVIIWLLRRYTCLTFKAIGKMLDRDHSTILLSEEAIDDYLNYDKSVNKDLETLKSLLNGITRQSNV